MKFSTKFEKLRRGVHNLLNRKFASVYHERTWAERFDNVLQIRTLLSLITRTILFVLVTLQQSDRYNESEAFLKEGGVANVELALHFFPYVKTIFIILNIIRAILALASFKWLWLTKGAIFLELSLQVVEHFMPVKVTLGRESVYQILMNYMAFWLCYFHWWSSYICSLLALVPLYISWSLYHNEP